MKHIVMFSGGVGSYAAAKRVAERHGTDDMVLLFTDTMTEDPDLYRFIHEAAADVGVPVTRIADGRTIWQLFREVRFLGNSQVAPCTTRLKRDVADKWLAEHCDQRDTICYVGIDWTEAHRFDGTATRKGLRRAKAEMGWTFEAPMCEPPYLAKWQMMRLLDAAGIRPPAMYGDGFAHNNCGGTCVKAGVGHWSHLWRTRPATYLAAEREEEAFRRDIRSDATILTETVSGKSRGLPLRELRQRICGGAQIDMFAIGGCGCFIDGDDP